MIVSWVLKKGSKDSVKKFWVRSFECFHNTGKFLTKCLLRTRLLNFPIAFLGILFRFSCFLYGIYQLGLGRGRDFSSIFFSSMCNETGVSSVEFLQAEEPYLGVIVGCQ